MRLNIQLQKRREVGGEHVSSKKALQLTANPLRGLPAAELGR